MNQKDNMKLIMECCGTFILASGINFSTIYTKSSENNIIQTGQPILLFLAFFAAITITRTISGGHINPAVTLSIYFSKDKEERRDEIKLSLFYMCAQIIGALFSAILSYIFYRKNVFKFTLTEGISSFQGFIIECVSTLIFTYTILCQGNKDANITNDPTISTFIITVALFGCCSISGNLTGGCLNPAIGIAQNFFRFCITGGDSNEVKYLWVYIFGPLLGGCLASALYCQFFYKHFKVISNCEKVKFLEEDNINITPQ